MGGVSKKPQNILKYLKLIEGKILMKKNITITLVFVLLFLLINGINDIINGATGIFDYTWVVLVTFAMLYNLFALYTLYINKNK